MPTAFISYSWESDEHIKWVRDLSSRLRSDGIDAKLDQWETAPGDQLPEFMENVIRKCDFVLIVCTPTYKQKSESRSGGVGYEGDIITSEVYVKKNHRKFIPLHRLGSWESAAPSWLLGKYYIDFTGDRYKKKNYKDLLDTLSGSRQGPPPIGEVKNLKNDQSLYDKNVFQQRMNHFHAEKYFLARKFTDLLLARIKHIAEEFDKHIFLFLDSGTTTFPFFEFIGESANIASKKNEKWITNYRLTIVTNNLPGIQSLLQYKGDLTETYSTDFPIDCRFLPGTASRAYLSVTGPETISAIENYKNTSNDSIFISL